MTQKASVARMSEATSDFLLAAVRHIAEPVIGRRIRAEPLAHAD